MPGLTDGRGTAPYSLTLTAFGFGVADGDIWQRVYVTQPTMLYPYRPVGVPDILTHLEIFYSPHNPLTSAAGYPESGVAGFRGYEVGRRGACYLWHPGEWWIGIRHLGTGASIPLPFWALPVPNAEYASHLLRGDLLTTRAPQVTRTSTAAGSTTSIATIQQILDGITAIQVWLGAANAANALRIGTAGSLQIPFTGIMTEFTGKTLPLSDLWFVNGTAGNVVMSTVYYY